MSQWLYVNGLPPVWLQGDAGSTDPPAAPPATPDKPAPRCECGGTKLRLPHSHWCPLADPEALPRR